jgi:hypothetical protein
VVSRDREWDFIFWGDTDYDDDWVDSVPTKPKPNKPVED